MARFTVLLTTEGGSVELAQTRRLAGAVNILNGLVESKRTQLGEQALPGERVVEGPDQTHGAEVAAAAVAIVGPAIFATTRYAVEAHGA